MEVNPFFEAAWMAFWLFMLGFSLCSGVASMDRMHRLYGLEFYRAPAKGKEELLYFCLFLWSFLVPIWTTFLVPACDGCLDGLLPGLNGWKAAAAFFIAPFFLGIFVPILFYLIQWGKARRNVHRFLNDCSAEGCIRAIYETTSLPLYGPFEWVLHDMMRDEHDMWQITKRAVNGYKDDPVYIAMNIPPGNVLQKLAQYNLVTKNGYERLPPPVPDHYFPQGGSIVHFYYQAEYVRIWG